MIWFLTPAPCMLACSIQLSREDLRTTDKVQALWNIATWGLCAQPFKWSCTPDSLSCGGHLCNLLSVLENKQIRQVWILEVSLWENQCNVMKIWYTFHWCFPITLQVCAYFCFWMYHNTEAIAHPTCKGHWMVSQRVGLCLFSGFLFNFIFLLIKAFSHTHNRQIWYKKNYFHNVNIKNLFLQPWVLTCQELRDIWLSLRKELSLWISGTEAPFSEFNMLLCLGTVLTNSLFYQDYVNDLTGEEMVVSFEHHMNLHFEIVPFQSKIYCEHLRIT